MNVREEPEEPVQVHEPAEPVRVDPPDGVDPWADGLRERNAAGAQRRLHDFLRVHLAGFRQVPWGALGGAQTPTDSGDSVDGNQYIPHPGSEGSNDEEPPPLEEVEEPNPVPEVEVPAITEAQVVGQERTREEVRPEEMEPCASWADDE